jgi:lectin family protein
VRIQVQLISAVSFLGLALTTTPAFADVIPLNSLNLVGTSQVISGGTLQLTDNTDPDPSGLPPAGAAWTNTEYNVAAPFSVNFQFQMTDPTGHLDNGNGGDGIAFLIQNSSAGDTAIGEGAGGMGFLGITDSVAVMLDTYQNGSPNYYGDPSNNYISVNTRGTLFNVPHHFCTDGQLTDITSGPMAGQSDLTGSSFSPDCTANPTLGMTGFGGVSPLAVNMDDGQVHDIEITYTGSMLDIYLDSSLVLAVSIDLATALDLQGGDDAFLGFTAGTRYAYQNQDILNFALVPEPAWEQLWVPLAMILAAALARKWRRSRV